jgi:hypothetical protein
MTFIEKPVVIRRKLENDGNTYITSVNHEGKEHTYKESPRIKIPRATGVASNKLSVEAIRKAGHKISVFHYRCFYSEMVKKVIALPKYTIRHCDPDLTLLSRGGYTRISITPATHVDSCFTIATQLFNGLTIGYGDTINIMSYCLPEDLFCYKTGVRTCLERVNIYFAHQLLQGPLR